MHGGDPADLVDRGRAGPAPADPCRGHPPSHPYPWPLLPDRGHRWQSGPGGGAADQGHRADRPGRALRPRLWSADNPGVWMVHCHIEHHMANGMMTTIWYEGYQPTGPAADAAVAEATMAADMGRMHHDETHSPTPTEADATQVPAGGTASEAVEIAMLDDRFQPDEATIPAGTTVTWVTRAPTGTAWRIWTYGLRRARSYRANASRFASRRRASTRSIASTTRWRG